FETDGGGSPTTTRTYALATKGKVHLRVSDGVGKNGTAEHEFNETHAPGSGGSSVGVSINQGAQYTNKPKVTLTIVAPPGTTSLLIANDVGSVGALPQPLASTVDWTLDSSGPERLPKTVYVRFLTGVFQSP